MTDYPTHHAWTLRKGARTLRCEMRHHLLGRELALYEGDELRRSQVVRDVDEMLAMVHAWREAAEAKGWAEEEDPVKES